MTRVKKFTGLYKEQKNKRILPDFAQIGNTIDGSLLVLIMMPS